mmetsp:Transcript_55134/g.176697  ORF Transcript_55134/g.176697 Transcript_55134/m.176697 type:complete len:239 (-) Transcript_55134:1231-1947(-)
MSSLGGRQGPGSAGRAASEAAAGASVARMARPSSSSSAASGARSTEGTSTALTGSAKSCGDGPRSLTTSAASSSSGRNTASPRQSETCSSVGRPLRTEPCEGVTVSHRESAGAAGLAPWRRPPSSSTASSAMAAGRWALAPGPLTGTSLPESERRRTLKRERLGPWSTKRTVHSWGRSGFRSLKTMSWGSTTRRAWSWPSTAPRPSSGGCAGLEPFQGTVKHAKTGRWSDCLRPRCMS